MQGGQHRPWNQALLQGPDGGDHRPQPAGRQSRQGGQSLGLDIGMRGERRIGVEFPARKERDLIGAAMIEGQGRAELLGGGLVGGQHRQPRLAGGEQSGRQIGTAAPGQAEHLGPRQRQQLGGQRRERAVMDGRFGRGGHRERRGRPDRSKNVTRKVGCKTHGAQPLASSLSRGCKNLP